MLDSVDDFTNLMERCMIGSDEDDAEEQAEKLEQFFIDNEIDPDVLRDWVTKYMFSDTNVITSILIFGNAITVRTAFTSGIEMGIRIAKGM
jgi:hypothetical protein